MASSTTPIWSSWRKRNAAKEGVADKATFVQADIFESDFSQATVLTLFLLTDLNIRLRPTILEHEARHARGVELVRHGRLDAGRDGAADRGLPLLLQGAPVDRAGEGRGHVEDLRPSDLVIEQKYQMLSGRLTTGNVIAPITDGKMTADQISFTAGGTLYSGRVRGNAIEGTSKAPGGTESPWQATRGPG